MLRTALFRPSKVFLLSSTTAAAVTYHHQTNNTKSDDGLVSSSTRMIQAGVRASRLSATAVLMFSDYYNPLLADNNNKASDPVIDNLQKTVDAKRQALHVAQTRHVDDSHMKHLELKDRLQAKKRDKLAMQQAALELAEAEEDLERAGGDNNKKSETHKKAATRLLNLCRTNKGVYIKVGQHLANLDYLIPPEYIQILSSLFDDTPRTDYELVRQVVMEELGAYPDDVFDRFDPVPIASASLAQVHVAYDKLDPTKKLAVKIQHAGLRETATGDVFALVQVIKFADWLLKDFTYGWIAEEIAPHLPKELDFVNEGRNSEQAAINIKQTKLDCVVPKVLWNQTSSRVLTMEFEEGFRSTDVEAIERCGLDKHDVAKLISSVFASQVFTNGFVHCDPHPGNVLLRKNKKTGKPQLILIDHGLYRKLDDDFVRHYAKLWRSLMLADLDGIKQSCESMGIVGEGFTLFSAMLTARPFDEIVERSQEKRSFGKSHREQAKLVSSKADQAVIRGYAQRFLTNIFDLIATLPRQMLLLLKMNDCLRHIDYALGSPANTLLVSGRFAANAMYKYERELYKNASWLKQWKIFWSYFTIEVQLAIHEVAAAWYFR